MVDGHGTVATASTVVAEARVMSGLSLLPRFCLRPDYFTGVEGARFRTRNGVMGNLSVHCVALPEELLKSDL